MPRESVREAVRSLADALHARHGVQARWDGDTVCVERAGMQGQLDFSGDTVRLGVLASPFAPRIKRAIQDYLDEHVT